MSIINCTDMFGVRKIQSAEYTDEIKEMQKTVVSFEIKLLKKLLKEANDREIDGACKLMIQLYNELEKYGLKLSLFTRDYTQKEIDDSRIILKVLLSHLPDKYMKWFKSLSIVHGKPTARVFIDDNIYEYNKNDQLHHHIVKTILPLFNLHVKSRPIYKKLHIGIDFDGVIHEHNIPFDADSKDLFGYKINRDIQVLCQQLKYTFDNDIKIDIVTMRGYSEQHTKMVKEYLNNHGIIFNEITTKIAPTVNIMIDDNAVLVQSLSDLEGLIPYIAGREPWHKKINTTKEKNNMATSTKKAAPKKAVAKKAAPKKVAKKTAAKKTAKK